ncbi:MAG: 30S ribosomal protein S12 methylthiotransferase RimO [Candidatus Caccovivens sp.]
MDKKLRNKRISAISLGCDKNRVDLEKMLFRLQDAGFEIVSDVSDAEIVIVNTCAFISPARQEAIDNIFEMCLLKNQNKLEKVIVTGCLAQRYKNEVLKEIPEVDAVVNNNDNIVQVVEKLYAFEPITAGNKNGRIFTNRGSYAYLKIAEGCNNACSYCTIPRIKGRYQSFDIDEIVSEAKEIAKQGIKELILVAQDVTRYGEDLYGKNRLIDLCKKLVKIEGIKWIRLHYAYPEKTNDELLNFIKNEPKMCKYLDIPLQHIDDRILKSMRRRLDEQNTRELIKKIKNDFSEIALRTTFIVGYPSETRGDFKKLYDFVKETKFDYAGFFPYYREENTPSYFMDKQISEGTKKHRLNKMLRLQRKIASEKAKENINETFTVLIDYFDEQTGRYIGHTQYQSPTVDFGVAIDASALDVGQFVNVKFIGFDGENYIGECL